MKYTGFLTAISKKGNLRYNGLNTHDATAIANDIVNTKTAYAQAEKIIGTLVFDGNATVNDVVASKTFFSDNPQTKLTGAIASLGATTYTPTTANQAIVNKYLTGLQTIKGDANLIPENIKLGTSLFGIDGTADVISFGIAYTSLDLNGNPITAVLFGKAYEAAAYNLTSLTSISIPSDVTVIERLAFSNCISLTNLTLPSGLTEIKYHAFYADKLLALSSLPNSITTIGEGAFYYCESMTLSEMPSSLTSLDASAFIGCKNVTFSTYPVGLTFIDSSGVFAGCEKVTFSVLPSGITTIGTSMYRDCKLITIEVIPSGITAIYPQAFSGCTSLTKIWIPDTCITINAPSDWQSPFYNCSPSLHIYCEASSKPAGWGTYWNYYDNTNQLTVTWNTTLAEFEAL